MKKRILALCLAALLTATLVSCASGEAALGVAELLDLGEKFLLDLDYEQAVVQFLKVIEIEPKNPRGYTGAAEAYIGLGETDSAVEILEDGIEALPDNTELRDRLNELQPPEESETSPDITEQALDVYLTAEQLAFLETLEAAVLAYDMERAFPLLQSAEFHEIFRNLPEENGNTYKLDDNGEWMLAYGSDENGHETFEIDLVTSWENGHVYLAEASVTDGVTTYAHMVTFDVVDGEVRHGETYNGIDVHVENGVVSIERRDESGAQ